MYPSRQSFEQDIARLLQQALRGPEHHRGDGHTDQWIDPLRSRHPDGDGSGQNSDIRNGVDKVMNKQTAQIQIAPDPHQRNRNASVDSQGQQRYSDHPAFMDGDGMQKALEDLVE